MTFVAEETVVALTEYYKIPTEDLTNVINDIRVGDGGQVNSPNKDGNLDSELEWKQLCDKIWQKVIVERTLLQYLESPAFAHRLSKVAMDQSLKEAMFSHLTDALAREFTKRPHPLAKLRIFSHEGKWWRYLLACCRNQVSGYRQRPTRQPLASLGQREIADERDSPLSVLIESENREILDRAINNLPNEQMRRMLRMVESGMTISQIAKQLNVSYAKVWRTIYKAIAHLRKTIPNSHYEDDHE
jgi:RNA polymerase sigma factor (sigma-70 family)